MITAWALTVPDAPLDEPAALFNWLSHADSKLQQEHGSEVVRRIMASDAPAATLRWIDDAAARERFGTDRPAVRARLLGAEIAQVRGGEAVGGDPLPPIDTDASARRDADSELSSAILLGSDAEVDLLLRLCRRHGVEPGLSPLRDRLSTFAIGWVDHPRRDYRPDEWALREPVLDLVHDELQERLAQRGVAGIADALQRLWPHLVHRPSDLADPLDCYIQVSAIHTLKGEQRLSRLNELIQQAGASPRAREEFACLQRVLVEGRVLGPAEALAMLQALPETVAVAPEAIERAVDEIERRGARPTSATLNALGVLDRRGIAPKGRLFADLLKADGEVLGFIEAARSGFGDDSSLARRWVKELGRAEPAVIQARLASLVAVCLECPAPGLGAAVLAVLPATLQAHFIARWGRELARPGGMHAAVWGVYWAHDPELDKLRPRIAATFRELGSKLGPDQEEEWFTAVQAEVGQELADEWAELAGHEPARSRRPWFRGREA